MDLLADPPLYLHRLHFPGVVGVNDHSRAAARARRAAESTTALLRIVVAEAEKRLGGPISLDLFATANNMK